MNKFKVSFILKQHTPIIHFQANQSGATLRATELKPKFDKFLLEKELNLPVKESANGHKSLEYKVKIDPNPAQAEDINQRNSLYFGNMGDGEEKKFKKYNKSFEIEFFSFKPQIIKAIKNNFEAFLANTNFGTRQSKGYGSFYLDNRDLDISLIPYKVFSFKSSQWERDIKLFYQFLRQGINLPRPNNPFYTKPAIFAYAKSREWQWEKKSIKEQFFFDRLQVQLDNHSNSDVLMYSSNEKYLLRDLFGLSSSENWRSYRATIIKEHQNIERFKSPITFKVVNNRVYFWVNSSYEEVLGEPFIIRESNNNQQFQIFYPQNFDFEEFLNFAININLHRHIENSFHQAREFKNLEKILNDIKVEN